MSDERGTNAGEITARDLVSKRPVRVCWQNGSITGVESCAASPEHTWIAPALFDLQVNGFAGVDFQQDDLSAEDLQRAAEGLRQAGCTRFLLTLITDEWTKLTNRLRHLVSIRSQSPELQAAISGWHIEGPFLSSKPGFHGAHNPNLMCDPKPEHIEELRTITGKDPLLLTLAPERAGALRAISLARSLGIKVSLGHTDAPSEVIKEAVEAGAELFTHLANGCPRELDRHDNILWRVFEQPGFRVSLIPDRIHVSPQLFRIIHQTMDAIVYTTDAMSAAGKPPGRYRLANLELEVGPDQVVRLPGKPLFAGSALRPIDGIRRSAEMLGRSWQEVWPHFSTGPAGFMGLGIELVAGQPAHFCRVTTNERNEIVEVAPLR